MRLREVLRHDRAARGEAARHPVEAVEAGDRRGIDPGHDRLLSRDLARIRADAGGRADARRRGDRGVGLGRVGPAVAVGADDDVVGVHLLLDGGGRGVPQAGAERGDDGDQGEPDHQRGRGRRGAPGVAHGVLARQAPGRAAEAAGGEADHRRDRLHEPRREQRDADEQGQHAAAQQQGDQAAATPGTNSATPSADSEAAIVASATNGPRRAPETTGPSPREPRRSAARGSRAARE